MPQIFHNPESSLNTIGDVDFLKDFIEVTFYRIRADTKPVGNFFIGGPHRDQGEDFDLPFGEILGGALWRRITFFKNASGHHLSGKPQFSS